MHVLDLSAGVDMGGHGACAEPIYGREVADSACEPSQVAQNTIGPGGNVLVIPQALLDLLSAKGGVERVGVVRSAAEITTELATVDAWSQTTDKNWQIYPVDLLNMPVICASCPYDPG